MQNLKKYNCGAFMILLQKKDKSVVTTKLLYLWFFSIWICRVSHCFFMLFYLTSSLDAVSEPPWSCYYNVNSFENEYR